MKTTFYTILICIAVFGMQFSASAQINARQNVLFEHFTNTSCGPCAAQNPVFQQNILEKNDGSVHHIAYHPWWPGADDPFYQFNIPENTNRTQYYGVNAVPKIFMRGNHWNGSPASVTWNQIHQDAADGSPVRIVVSETTNGNTRNVHIEIQSVNTPPSSGNWILHCAVIERNVTTATPPGTNGETYFPNVFRKFIKGVGGTGVILPAKGQSKTYDFSYTLDPVWNPDEIAVVAFLQNTVNKEVLNSGSSYNSGFEFLNAEDGHAQEAALGGSVGFTSHLVNITGTQTDVTIKLTSEAPADWSASYTFDGQTYTGTTTKSIASDFDEDIELNVNVGQTKGIGTYTISVESPNNPDFEPQSLTYIVVSGVVTLVVNNDQPFANGKNYDWSDLYVNGLAEAGATDYGELNASDFAGIVNKGGLQSVQNIFYNVGWTTPPFTSETVNALETFIGRGGNLLISGQDIAWAALDLSSPYRTLKNQMFVKNILGADYVKDGNLLNNAIFPEADDAIFGNNSTGSLVDRYSNGMYPDEISISAEGASKAHMIYYYDAGKSKGAAVRTYDGTAKTVYLAFGLEQIVQEEVRTEIMNISYEWFTGQIAGIDFDRKMAELIQIHPNPASDFIRFELPENLSQVNVRIYDMNGRIINNGIINANSTFSVSDLESGLYLYELRDHDGNMLKSDKFSIIR